MDAELRRYVLVRDGRCFASRVDPDHVCRDRYGRVHRPDDLAFLTVDHVHLHAGGTKGLRAPTRRENLVALCWAENTRPPSRALRAKERAYLLSLYPGATCCEP